ncbi:MAG: hypothetical protein J1E85_10290 [Ruminococcus sp.]|nr:hypothetical protein [Ruminococcus sp.]
MIEATMQWHRAEDELPEKSCEVVVAHFFNGKIYSVSSTDYSFKNKTFNCGDNSPDKIVRNSYKYSKDVVFWAYLDELTKSLENKEKRGEK